MTDAELMDKCGQIVDQGIDYAIRGNYWNYVLGGVKLSGLAIGLCERILCAVGNSAQFDRTTPLDQRLLHDPADTAAFTRNPRLRSPFVCNAESVPAPLRRQGCQCV